MKKEILIELKNIKKSYFSEKLETPILHGISLQINRGEFVAVMGASGAGKSTLLHIFGFLDRATSGEYFFENKKMATYSDEEMARIRNEKMGFVFQAFNLLPRTTVLDNVKLPLFYSQVPASKWDKVARNALESVGLSHRLDHEPSQLSGGEKQRVAIARSLVCDPPIIFADEPTGNLDSKSGIAIMKIIKDLHQKEGRTVVLITHETTTAQFADRLIRVVDGVIEYDGKMKKHSNFSQPLK
jgi:ABC-type lipoprotein export system ATPase subunit